MINQFDYIFSGGGLAGLMTAYKMSRDTYFSNKKILIIDKAKKNQNDRTWCFWEKEAGYWDKIVSKTWDKVYIGDSNYKKSFIISPLIYKSIKALDFYNYVLNELKNHDNIKITHEDVLSFSENSNSVEILTSSNTYTSDYLFNSILNTNILKQDATYPYLKQHFIGWFIKSINFSFDDSEVKFMDFSVEQKSNTRFMYMLPFSKDTALFEYTLFSNKVLDELEYENAIEIYLNELGIKEYEIIQKEKGNIPMTAYPFHKHNTERVLNIGIAGGWAKASTGYTFYNSHKLSSKLIEYLKNNTRLKNFNPNNRFRYYDGVFLETLDRHNELGANLLIKMFQNNSINKVLKFLNNETSLFEDLKIVSSLPKKLFTISALRFIKKIIF